VSCEDGNPSTRSPDRCGGCFQPFFAPPKAPARTRSACDAGACRGLLSVVRGTLVGCPVAVGSAPGAAAKSPLSRGASPVTTHPARGTPVLCSPAPGHAQSPRSGRHNPLSTDTHPPSSPGSCPSSERFLRTLPSGSDRKRPSADPWHPRARTGGRHGTAPRRPPARAPALSCPRRPSPPPTRAPDPRSAPGSVRPSPGCPTTPRAPRPRRRAAPGPAPWTPPTGPARCPRRR
jgi:hypothetical protein